MKEDKNNIYQFDNATFSLPIEETYQKYRIEELLSNNQLDIKLLDNFYVFSYGSDKFWL